MIDLLWYIYFLGIMGMVMLGLIGESMTVVMLAPAWPAIYVKWLWRKLKD